MQKINKVVVYLAVLYLPWVPLQAQNSGSSINLTIDLSLDFGVFNSYRLVTPDAKKVFEGNIELADATSQNTTTPPANKGRKITFSALPAGSYTFAVLSMSMVEEECLFSRSVTVEPQDNDKTLKLTVTNTKFKNLSIGMDSALQAVYMLNKGHLRIERLPQKNETNFFKACAPLRITQEGVMSKLFGLEPGLYRLSIICPLQSHQKPTDIFSWTVFFNEDDFNNQPLRVTLEQAKHSDKKNK